jgi:hypothetical protein
MKLLAEQTTGKASLGYSARLGALGWAGEMGRALEHPPTRRLKKRKRG